MKQKKLANVLVKILGLSLLPQSLLHLITGVFSILSYWDIESSGRGGFGPSIYNLTTWSNVLSGAILGIIGLGFMMGSRAITESLFRGEVE
jgi:hypothetical protein